MWPKNKTQTLMRLPYGTYSVVRTYKLEVLYEHVNILKWWKGDEKLFPTIAIMARVYFSRELTSCFQERGFSSAGYTGNKLRTRTLLASEEKLYGWEKSIEMHIKLKYLLQ